MPTYVLSIHSCKNSQFNSIEFSSCRLVELKSSGTKMLALKAIFISVAFTVVVSTADYQLIGGIKRSAVCLIQRIANHNHITAKYEKISQVQKNGTTSIRCKLDLGTEEYMANSTSLSMAKEKVSRQAYALTKYQKPPLTNNRTCIIHQPNEKSDISLLEEYGQSIQKHVIYSEKARHQNGTFECDVTLDGKSASGVGVNKKSAKTDAATHLLNAIGRSTVVNALTAKYNQPRYHSMDPVERLRKILRVTALNGDGIYKKINEVSEGSGKRFVAQVITSDVMANGSGATYEEACSNAAVNVLKNMNFIVTYIYRPDTHRK